MSEETTPNPDYEKSTEKSFCWKMEAIPGSPRILAFKVEAEDARIPVEDMFWLI